MVNVNNEKYNHTALKAIDKFTGNDQDDMFSKVYFDMDTHRAVVGILENAQSSKVVSVCYSILANLTYDTSSATIEVA